MLSYLQGKESQNEGYTDLSETMNYKLKSFREYYSHKLETFKSDTTKLIEDDEKENLTYPHFHDYWRDSLN